jgi:hypothetical protein
MKKFIAFIVAILSFGAQNSNGAVAMGMQMQPTANDFFKGSTNTTRGKVSGLNGDISDFLYYPYDGTDFFTYQMKITNTESTDETIILNPSYDPSNANSVTDGDFLSTSGAGHTLNGVGDKRTIVAFKAWVKKNPLLCTGVYIETDNTKQLSKSIKLIYKNDPFQTGTGDRTIRFSDYKKESRFQDKELLVSAPFVWDDQTEIQLVCAGGGVDGDAAAIEIVTTYTWKFRYAFSTELAFRKFAMSSYGKA